MSMSFPKLEGVMHYTGFGREITTLALDWLDVRKVRDMELLNRLTLQENKLRKFNSGYYREAIQAELVPANSDELYKRFILMAYKLLDAEAFDLTTALHSALSGSDKDRYSRLFSETMTEVYGDEAPARIAAVDYCSACAYFGLRNHAMPEDPALLLKAAELTSEKLGRVKLMLCANALELIPLPEGGKPNEDAERAVALIKSVMRGGIEENDPKLLTALAAGSYFDVELKAGLVKHAAEKAKDISDCIFVGMKRKKRVSEAFFLVEGTLTQELLGDFIAHYRISAELLEAAAKMQTEVFVGLMSEQKSVEDISTMNNVLKAVKPDKAMKEDIYKRTAQEKIAENVALCFDEPDKIKAFINGEIPFDEVYPIIKSANLKYGSYTKGYYIKNFGKDDFIMRCVAVLGGSVGSYSGHLYDIAGFGTKDISDIAKQLYSCGLNTAQVLEICGNILDLYNNSQCDYFEEFAASFSEYADDVAAEDITKFTASVKQLALTIFQKDEVKYKENILSLAGDTAKSVRDMLVDIVLKHPEWDDDVKAMLASKKSSARDFALTVIERQGAKAYIPELKKALSAEKTDKLKARIASVISAVSGEEAVVTASAEEIVNEMTKGKKTAKLDWLFEKPFPPVHKKDGTTADESYVKALMLCFANSVGIKDPNADIITAELEPKDVKMLSLETLGRWLTTVSPDKKELYDEYKRYGIDTSILCASSKYKWVLYLAGVYGGEKALEIFDELMGRWPLYQKGALAKEIPHAIVLNGSSEYIMRVEKMSRKHKFNSIRKASADALLCAAEKLGMSKEEFADLMVPDLDFDEHMCRTFDYGSRQFKVYISPTLEPEIFCDAKKLKSMPKPCDSDDKTKAEAAYKEFTAMKKLMKTIVSTQRIRLENTLRTARSWTAENWKKLFVENPIMHSFAIGLIWGIYENNKLKSCFRYLDDGSFTTVDEKECIIPENAVIGLVHPVELSEEELTAWKQQLKDYDIIQPFAQLDRTVFRASEDEKGVDCIERFKGIVMKNTELAGAMSKIGWSKGAAGDGAMIDDFVREDIFTRNNGIKAVLRHSGMSVEIFRGETVDVTVGELYFYRIPGEKRMDIADLNERYFSEMIYQLSKVFVK